MEINLVENEIMKLCLYWPSTRKIFLYNDDRLVGELFIQKKDLFFTNFYSVIQRLKSGEITEIRYSSSDDEVISIMAFNNKYVLSYITENIEKEKKMLKIFTSYSYDNDKLSIGTITVFPRSVVKKIEVLK